MAKVQEHMHCRPPLERMMRIHQLVENRQYPNCTKLAREFEVSTRTIKRDIDFLKTRLGLPLEFDVRRNGYYFTRPVPHFPQLPMSEAETFALLVAHKAIAQYHGTPFQRPLEAAFRRLTGQLDQTVRFSLGSLDEVLSFRPFAPMDADLEMFPVLTRGLRERRALKFLYRNHGAARSQQRLVHPYHLACIENQWYLFAFDVRRQGMRTFALARLRAPELLPQRFTISSKFDPNQYLEGSLSVFKGSDDYEVVIEFDAWAADMVRGRRWHPRQELTELPGGVLRLRLRLNSLEEAEAWVLGFGAHATVVRPQALAERLRRTARALIAKYPAPDDPARGG
ncbi:MAG TPA: transcriptional regulator [Candidatus Paceibacterota bacterium]|nr:transcriptional regulator [Candidatus Paceibacterota bacterium]